MNRPYRVLIFGASYGSLLGTKLAAAGHHATLVALGADPADLVPFDKYAAAATGLAAPSSAARAIFAGVPYIERVDKLVQGIAAHRGMRNAEVDEIVALVDERLAANRRAAA